LRDQRKNFKKRRRDVPGFAEIASCFSNTDKMRHNPEENIILRRT
jgi:hypothetical protein